MHIDISARRRHSIGLTPLIDVVFILLVFFMLATSLTDWRGISLATGSSVVLPNQPPPAVVHLGRDDHLALDGTGYPLKKLAALLKTRLRSGEISSAIVRPDSDVTLGSTVRVLDALAGDGVNKLALGDSEN